MGKYNSYCYPRKWGGIDTCNKDSKYIIKIIAPKDICVAFNKYALDFYDAAYKITRNLVERNNTEILKLDAYFFSLAFLYRHSIELKLKAIVFQIIKSSKNRSNFVKHTFHNLEEILKVLECISPNLPPEKEMDWLKRYFSDISKIDKDSDSFRYPFHIKRSESYGFKEFTMEPIYEEQINVDLVKFANKFEAAYEILDNWYKKSLDDATGWKELEPIFMEEGGLYYGQSVVGYTYSRGDFYPYTIAYLETANYLRQYIKEQIDLGNYDKVSGLFMPMCYLYRNCVELNLKTIWFEETGEDFQKRCKSIVVRKHSIIGMWNLIKTYAESCVTGNDGEADIEDLEGGLYSLHDIDPDSSKFRYPVKKDMTPYFKENKRVDFMEIGILLETLNDELDSICITLEGMNEQNFGMGHEYSSEMQCNNDYY